MNSRLIQKPKKRKEREERKRTDSNDDGKKIED